MKDKITKDMVLGEMVAKYPESASVFARYGLHCIGCFVAAWETLEQGAMAHGIKGKEFDEMMRELKKLENKGRGKGRKKIITVK